MLLQIGIGLIPATLIVVITTLVRKNFKIKNVAPTCTIAGLCVLCLVSGIVTTLNDKKNTGLQVPEEDMYKMIYGLVENGSYDMADNLLEQAADAFGYTKECSLIRARIKALTNDFKASKMIFLNISSDDVSQEKEYIDKVVLAQKVDTAIQNMLEQTGNSTDNSNNDAILSEAKDILENNKIFTAISESITKKYGDIKQDTMYSVGNLIGMVNKCYDDYKNNGYTDEEELKRVTFSIDNILSKMPSLSSLKYYREARLKVNILNSDYDKIAKQIDKNSGYNELMVVSQLYINGFIKEEDFSDYLRVYDYNDLQKIRNHMQELYQKGIGNRSARDNDKLKESIKTFDNIVNNMPLLSLKSEIAEFAEDTNNLSAASKLYYQAAKIDNYLGNEASAEENLSKSFDAVGNCDDFSFAEPVYEIINIMKGENSSENIKNVSDYIDIIEENSMPIYVEESSDGNEQQKDFNNAITDYVSKTKSAINIGEIDYSKFPQIEARIQISGDYITEDTDLKSILEIYDCGIKIDNYSIEKVVLEGSNVQLVCDNSGSMSGSVSKLKEAVEEYINYKLDDEDISIVAFDDDILFTYGFGSSIDELQEAISKFDDLGGTDIYGTLVSLLNDFPSDKNKNNIIILLTDGEDNSPASYTEIFENIGEQANNKNIIIYTLGIGSSVDTEYLTTIAESTGGSFVYVNDIATLSTFYDLIHQQIKNQYTIKYTAIDTLTSFNRSLEVKIPDESVSTIKYYSLSEENLENYNSFYADGLSVTGLVPRTIYKDANEKDRIIQIKGTGFKSADNLIIKLDGSLSYTLYPKFVDAETFEVTLKAGMPEGSYNATFILNGRKAYIQNALLIVDGELDKIEFGDYVFYAVNISHKDDTYTLSGGVNLNHWLNFKSDVTISGNLENTKVQMTDNGGSYVVFDEKTAQGITKTFAEKGWSVDFPAMGTISLYNTGDDYTEDEYPVDRNAIQSLKIKNFINLINVDARLYPDRFKISFSSANTIIPFQDVIIQSLSGDSAMTFDGQFSGVISKNNIGLIVDFEREDDSDISKKMKVFNRTLPVNLSDLEIHINTLEGELGFKVGVGLPFVNLESVGLEVSWIDLDLDTLMLCADYPITKLIYGVPVTFKDFQLGAADMASSKKIGSSKDIISTKLVGRFEIDIANIGEICPPLKKYIDDVELFTMPDTEVQIGLDQLLLSANAELKFLDEIKLSEAEIELGTIEGYYEPLLFENSGENVFGLYAKLKQGLMWEIPNCNVDISGTGEFNFHSKFIGCKYTGTAQIDIKWWLFNKKIDKSGSILVGFYFPDNDVTQFTIRTRIVDDKGKVSGDMLYISSKGLEWVSNYLD